MNMSTSMATNISTPMPTWMRSTSILTHMSMSTRILTSMNIPIPMRETNRDIHTSTSRLNWSPMSMTTLATKVNPMTMAIKLR